MHEYGFIAFIIEFDNFCVNLKQFLFKFLRLIV